MKLASSRVVDKAWLFFGPLFVGLVAADQLTKWWAMRSLDAGAEMDFGFQLTYNNGVVFGLDLPIWAIWILTLGVLVLGAWMVYENKLWRDKWHLTGLALILAGAIGNMIDRFRFGYVIDFIKVYFWPNFNLADAFIVIGVLVFSYEFLVREEGVAEI